MSNQCVDPYPVVVFVAIVVAYQRSWRVRCANAGCADGRSGAGPGTVPRRGDHQREERRLAACQPRIGSGSKPACSGTRISKSCAPRGPMPPSSRPHGAERRCAAHEQTVGADETCQSSPHDSIERECCATVVQHMPNELQQSPRFLGTARGLRSFSDRLADPHVIHGILPPSQCAPHDVFRRARLMPCAMLRAATSTRPQHAL